MPPCRPLHAPPPPVGCSPTVMDGCMDMDPWMDGSSRAHLFHRAQTVSAHASPSQVISLTVVGAGGSSHQRFSLCKLRSMLISSMFFENAGDHRNMLSCSVDGILLVIGMASCSPVHLSQISGASSHRRSIWCRHQPADGNVHMAHILCVSAVQTTVAVKGNNHVQGAWGRRSKMQSFEHFTALI